MNRYWKLVHMEIHRFRYMLAGLMAITVIFQLVSLILTLSGEVAKRKEALMKGDSLPSNSAYLVDTKLSFAWAIFHTQIWFIIPILVCIAALAIYIFLIWYRDWLGRNTFIYRLLMLPTERRNVYLAKTTAILAFVFSLAAFQLLLLVVEKLLFNLMVPSGMREASYFSEVVTANRGFAVLLPFNFDQLLFNYGLGIMAVLVIFAAILLERSYRLAGIFYAVLYVVACLAAFLIPGTTLGLGHPGAYLYPNEIFAVELVICAAIAAISVWLAFRLLNKKITV